MSRAVLSPSVLAADFSKIGDEIEEIEKAGCRFVHLDVMDGRFVPNITFGAQFISAARKRASKIVFDTHLMIDKPERYVKDFVNCGSDYITVHIESTNHIHNCLKMIRESGVKAGVALNPGTSINLLEETLPFVDMVLVMSVNPGFGGQAFIKTSINKIGRLDKIRKAEGYKFFINVDGGVGLDNCDALKDAGADILVSGSAYFKSVDKKIFREKMEA